MDGNHDDDDDLQAALALSMQHPTSNNNNNDTPASTKRSNMDTSPTNTNNNNHSSNISNSEFNCKSFHKLMWNDNTTTLNDKERWIYECISTPSLSTNNSNGSEDSSDKPSIATAAAMSTEKIIIESNSKEGQQESDLLTPLQIFTNSTVSINPTTISTTKSSTATSSTTKQPIWGLTQKHGGPCGVLASIQESPRWYCFVV